MDVGGQVGVAINAIISWCTTYPLAAILFGLGIFVAIKLKG